MHDMLDELYEISLDKEFQIGAEFEYQHAVMFSLSSLARVVLV